MADPVSSTIYPSLTYDDPQGAIEFLCRAFGFRTRLIVPRKDGGVLHSELSLGDAVVMVSSPKVEQRRISPIDLHGMPSALSVYVEDPDAHHARAKAEGADIIRPLADEPFGARGYLATDPEGHQWFFANYRPGSHWTD